MENHDLLKGFFLLQRGAIFNSKLLDYQKVQGILPDDFLQMPDHLQNLQAWKGPPVTSLLV